MTDIRVLIADDNPIVRAGLITLLEAGNFAIAAEAANGREAIEQTRQTRPDLVLLDVRMPLLDGIGAVEELSTLAKVVMLTHTEDASVVRTAIKRGASGYLVHGSFSAEDLATHIRAAVNGGENPLSPAAVRALMDTARSSPEVEHMAAEFALTNRETEIIERIAQGMTNSAIAAELVLSEKTVKNHINHIYAKLGVNHRSAAIAQWNGTTRASTRGAAT